MSNVAIRVEGLSKQYRIGGAPPAATLREALDGVLRRSWSRPHEQARPFWALRDVSFTVRRGEVVGVIGPNGAGKSTLLKILSRITEPTRGRVELHGRVGSLLEVGTGFHPELSGRENIYLNGAILGMRRREIAARFEEIVAFAELDEFIDTPVKRYSSGMPTSRPPTRSLRSVTCQLVRTRTSGSRNQSSRGPGTTRSSMTSSSSAATGAWSSSGNSSVCLPTRSTSPDASGRGPIEESTS